MHDEFESRSSAACTSLCVAKVAGRSRAPALSIHEGRHLEVKLLFPALHHTARPPSHRAVSMLASHINPLSGRAALVGRLAQPPRQCASPVAQTHQQPPISALQLLDSPRFAPRRHFCKYLHAPPHLAAPTSQKRCSTHWWVQCTAWQAAELRQRRCWPPTSPPNALAQALQLDLDAPPQTAALVAIL